MADTTLPVLLGAAASIGFIHTVAGPDHYLPFVAMSRAGRWSLAKTLLVTVLCGIGHVGSSVLLGAVGLGVGAALERLEWFEGHRGALAGWLLLGFGLVYMVWGMRRAHRSVPHTHVHAHADGTIHHHHHDHHGEHAHPHAEPSAATMTPWILFTIFVFGPCEPLIPLLMFPAALHSAWGVALVTLVFGLVTIATMTTIVAAATLGLGMLSFHWLERYSHAAAGFAVAACGLAVTLGL